MIGLRSRIVVTAIALASVGCAENAILEVTLNLPAANPGDLVFALVEVASAEETGFDGAPFDEASSSFPAFQLQTMPENNDFEIETEREAQDVLIKVRFCDSAECTSMNDMSAPEVRYQIERPFFEGRYSSFKPMIQVIPAPSSVVTEDISRCEIGCEGVQSPEGGDWCTSSGSHLCD